MVRLEPLGAQHLTPIALAPALDRGTLTAELGYIVLPARAAAGSRPRRSRG